MNSVAATKALAESFVVACNAGDAVAACALLDSSAVVSVSGNTWFSGRFAGSEQIRRILVPTLRDYLFEARVGLVDVIAEDGYVAATAQVSGRSRGGEIFERAGSSWGLCFEIRNGLIVAIDVFPDTMFVETVLCGAVYKPNDPARVLA